MNLDMGLLYSFLVLFFLVEHASVILTVDLWF